MKNRAFTLIEMLVVVAVIGILSSVLLTALGPARDKAKDARIVEEVNQVRSIAETLYNGNYDALETLPSETISNQNLRALADDITVQGGLLTIVKSSPIRATGYMAYSPLNTKVGDPENPQTDYYCIDSGGRVGFTTADLSTVNNARCPF
jgi:prepilin-type N-terminal cleavage/methylation domain-containing protein